MQQTPHVLVVDDEPNVRKVLATLLEQAGYTATRADCGASALDLVRAQDPDLVITDLKMPGMDGLELLARMRGSFPEIPVLMLTAHGTVENAVEAMKRGAYDFLTKPFDKAQVVEVVGKALGQAASSRREYLGPEAPGGFIGEAAPMVELRRMIEKIAGGPTTVLILGETGTGKELIADALHHGSPRRERPLIKINCGALPENLVESELFGHERGAFSGADRAKPGRFELADGGTLFLDEIGELPAAAQVKLLRVLEDGVIDRVGGTEPRKVDVRLIAATHRDLQHEVAQGSFREDLLYRLNVISLVLPPLRERVEDIPLLVEAFLGKHAQRLNRPRCSVPAATMQALMARDWPGNVRELENAVERAVLLADAAELTAYDFGLQARPSTATATAGPATGLKEASRAAAEQTERRMIQAALATTDGNVTHAAERLGLSRRGLQMKMKELGLR